MHRTDHAYVTLLLTERARAAESTVQAIRAEGARPADVAAAERRAAAARADLATLSVGPVRPPQPSSRSPPRSPGTPRADATPPP